MSSPPSAQTIAKQRAELCRSLPHKTALIKAIDDLRERPHRLDHCMAAMRMTTVPKALLWKRIKALAS